MLAASGALGAQPAASRSRAVRAPVTFSNQIVRLFQNRCQNCHRPGTVAPFSLLTYADARPNARRIKTFTQTGEMPPWKPVAGHGEFAGERRLTQQEIDLIARWVDAGAPEGDPRDLPPPLPFSEGWAFGQPDLILEPEADFQVPADDLDTYRCFSLPTHLIRDRFLIKLDFQPGARSIVHHILLMEDALGVSALYHNPDDPQPGFACWGGSGIPSIDMLGVWSSGFQPEQLPSGFGLHMESTSRIIMQVHYHNTTGRTVADRSRAGLYFSPDRVPKEVVYLPLFNPLFRIPPGDPKYTVRATVTLPPGVSARIVFIFPHMHLLGREIRVEAVYPNSARRSLLYIDHWDLEWQDIYYLRDPILLPPLTRLELTAVYDNSEENPHNPNHPPRAVAWGEQTTDEMCLAFLGLVLE